jgi:thiamine biosynthesis lipoprotein ApbE
MSPPGARLLFLLLLVGAVALVVLSRGPLQIRNDRPGIASLVRYQPFHSEVMATTIQALLPEGPDAPALAETVFAVFRTVDARMSEWKPTSPLSAVNAAAGEEPVPVPADLRQS